MIITGTRALYFNTNFASLSQLISFYSLPPLSTDPSATKFEVDHTDDAVTLDLIFAWVTAGGEVESYPCFIRFSETAFARDVPDFVPGDTKLNDDEVEVKRTWVEWRSSNFDEHPKYGDYYYVPSDAMGQVLPGSILKQLHDLSGVNVVTVEDFKDARPDTGIV